MGSQNKFQINSSDKLGLCLSGGGFRAALFHIGTLARMAELDLLRQVQVLSTVSGGSIIGAMYYLKLKQLLEERRPDGLRPSKEAYIQLVQELEKEFLAGVQTNIRVRIFLNPFKNAKLLLSDDYSRSDRLSELYHETFYQPIWNPGGRSFRDRLLDVFCIKDSRAILLRELKIYPPGKEVGFDVHDYNNTAEFKIPILAINATTLNTGEHWKFTASSAGVQDQPGDNHPSLTLYPRLYFDDPTLTEKQKNKLNSLTLSDAVAASACVPALFTPLPIHDLYTTPDGEETVVELVDGGVYDNQGLATLFDDEKCSHIICSDASGQFQFDRTPSSKEFAVLLRSNDVLMERIRGLQTENLDQRPNTGFWHLRDGFQPTAHFPAFSPPNTHSDGSSNGQIFLLSAIRTDLDAFSNIEARALMYDAYCLCDQNLNQAEGLNSPPSDKWRFMDTISALTNDSARLTKHLSVAENLFFKTFLLMGMRGRLILSALIAAALVLAWWGLSYLLALAKDYLNMISDPALLAGMILFVAVVWIVLDLLPKHIRVIKKLADTIRKIRTGKVWGMIYLLAAVTVIASAVAYIYLKFINPKYLKLGE